MKPFDLEAAKAGKKLVTRDGRKARFVAHIPEAKEDYRLIALVEGDLSVNQYFDDGVYLRGNKGEEDLFMAPEKRTFYVNVKGDFIRGFDTEHAARMNASRDAEIVAHKIELEV